MLFDKQGREISYLRLAVTDRCNLRCFYCMPESGIKYAKRTDLLSFEELERLVRVFSKEGIRKVRITGGEPFVRKGIMDFLEKLSQIEGLEEINVTTNGTFTLDKIKDLKALGIQNINLSLDTLDPGRFKEITRRDLFPKVNETYQALIEEGFSVKLNMVVMQGRNIDDIFPMLEETKLKDISVRFIEEMPFNGSPELGNQSFWPADKILDHIRSEYEITKLEDPAHSTSQNFRIKGYKGSFGLIPAFTRNFCGSCNRIRLTPQGSLRTCLYGEGVVNFRDKIRAGASDQELVEMLKKALNLRALNGFEAEQMRSSNLQVSESMATIGG